MFKISELLKSSDKIANLLPNILAESAVLTRDIIQGLHSSRFAGKGETFWQFKEYRIGDNINSIDWRKSAASNKLLVKEKENVKLGEAVQIALQQVVGAYAIAVIDNNKTDEIVHHHQTTNELV